MSAEQRAEQTHTPPMPTTCECDFDPGFHRHWNKRLRGVHDDPTCHQPPADHMNGWPGGVVASPALCMGCLFGCAE